MVDLKDTLGTYIKRVKDLAEHVKGNEQATKQSLIGPLFSLLGYDMTDPRECIPEFRVDFGKDRSVKPIDWAFQQNSRPIFFVEAKEVGRKLAGYDEQLADYFAKEPLARLGILTNGIQWRFFTDYKHDNIMDKEPFVRWDVLTDETPPIDFLTLLQKSQFNPQLLRTFAQRLFEQNLLLESLTKLLEPSTEFIRLAIGNIETRKLTESVIQSWKPVLVNAIEEWTKQRMLTMVLSGATQNDISDSTQAKKVITTKEEIDGYETIKKLLGADRPVAYTDTVSYFKVHFPDRPSRVVCRLYFDTRKPRIWVPVPISKVEAHMSNLKASFPQVGWIAIALDNPTDVGDLGAIIRATYDHLKAEKMTQSTDQSDDDEDASS